MDRIRLTKRASRSKVADSATPQTAIDLGKNRTYHKIDEYHTFEPSLNHWTPDMRHDWKENPREETGHGIPKMAKVYMSAKKATRLASLFLGKNAGADAVEKQARAFMRMGDKALTASLNLYAECNGQGCDVEKASAPAPVEEAPAPAPVEAEEAPAPAPAPVEAEEASAPAPAPVEEAPAPAPVEAEEEAPAPAPVEEAPADVEVTDAPADAEIEFDEPADGTVEVDDELVACFEGTDEGGEEVVAPAGDANVARKAGIKKLAGQPTLVRVASKKADELADLWSHWENPDVR